MLLSRFSDGRVVLFVPSFVLSDVRTNVPVYVATQLYSPCADILVGDRCKVKLVSNILCRVGCLVLTMSQVGHLFSCLTSALRIKGLK